MLKKVLVRYFPDKKSKIIIILILVVVFFRFLWLDRFPVGITHDEAELLLSSKSYWLYGHDISGTPLPTSLFATQMESKQTGVVSLLLSPYFGLTKFSLFTNRIPFVITNILSGLLIGLILHILTKQKFLALIAVLIFYISPWSLYYSRVTIEAPFALFMLLLGIFILFSRTKNYILFSLPAFIISAFSYLAALPTVPLIFLSLSYIRKKQLREKSSVLLISSFVFFSLVISYIFISSINNFGTVHNRRGEISLLNVERYTPLVNEQRRQSIENPLRVVSINKFTVLANDLMKKYLSAFDVDTLFLTGDPRATYRFGNHGFLYFADAIFLVLGITTILKYSPGKLNKIIATLIIIAPLGSVLSSVENSYIFRSFSLLPAFTILISLGIWFIWKYKPSHRKLYITPIIIIYVLSLVNFNMFYFLRYSVTQQENHYLSERVVSKYIVELLKKEDLKLTIITDSPVQIYNQYLLFSNDLKRNKKPLGYLKTYFLENLKITSNCSDILNDRTVIIKSTVDCGYGSAGSLKIQDQKDSGTFFYIHGDNLCTDISMTPYRREHKLSDYNIEDMNRKDFCNRWINI